MPASSLARVRCYWILVGIEQSLARMLEECPQFEDRGSLAEQQREKALKRLQEEQGDENPRIDHLMNADLLPYLDLGDLTQLLNRHSGPGMSVDADDARKISEIMDEAKIGAVRKRVMHPVRPLEETDLLALIEVAGRLTNQLSNLNWSQLRQNLIQQESGGFGNLDIPAYWAEELEVQNNLPEADFDETGFIGRRQERRQLAARLQSDQRVLTLVGEAGTGKTALALRVINDLVENGDYQFERIVWVTMKTRAFTSAGIQEIANAIDSTSGLIRQIENILNISPSSPNWDDVIAEMSQSRTLLVIDNLETLGDELRELFLGVPQGSKVLTTSRIGLGEIEERFSMPDFDKVSAESLFRSLAKVYNYKSVLRIDSDEIHTYCTQLSNRPLLIKWFVHALANGADPKVLPVGTDFQEALRFCYENVFNGLDDSAKRLSSMLLAARAELSRAQLQDLLAIDHVAFEFAIQSLIRSSIVTQVNKGGSKLYKIEGLVQNYLSRNHSPDNQTVELVRSRLLKWSNLTQQSAYQSRSTRYYGFVINVTTTDEQVAQRYLKQAWEDSNRGEHERALASVDTAERLTPDWWEVPRIKAKLLINKHAPIYDIEEEFERAISLTDSDIPRYHYAVFSIKQSQYTRAIKLINQALTHPEADPSFLLNQRATAYTRLARNEEALEDLYTVEEVQHAMPFSSEKNLRITYTKIADVHLNMAHQAKAAGDNSKALEFLLHGLKFLQIGMEENGIDAKIAIQFIELGEWGTGAISVGPDGTHQQTLLTELCTEWDDNSSFRHNALKEPTRLSRYFSRIGGQAIGLFPKTYEGYIRLISDDPVIYATPDDESKLIGHVMRIIQRPGQNRYGFIFCPVIDETIYFNWHSLDPDTKLSQIYEDSGVAFTVERYDKGLAATNLVVLEPD